MPTTPKEGRGLYAFRNTPVQTEGVEYKHRADRPTRSILSVTVTMESSTGVGGLEPSDVGQITSKRQGIHARPCHYLEVTPNRQWKTHRRDFGGGFMKKQINNQ